MYLIFSLANLHPPPAALPPRQTKHRAMKQLLILRIVLPRPPRWLGAPKRLPPVRSSAPTCRHYAARTAFETNSGGSGPESAKCSMVPVQVLQSIFTLAFDQSRSNTPEPGDVSLQIPCGTP